MYRPPHFESFLETDSARDACSGESTVIEGIVSAHVQGALQCQGFQVHCFSFAAWRPLGGAIAIRKLVLRRPVQIWQRSDFRAFMVYRLRVRLSAAADRAIVEKFEPIDADEEFARIGSALQEPVVIETKTFGDLYLDDELDRFDGEATWLREEIEIHFAKGEDEPAARAIATAELIWANQAEWQRQAERLILKELLQLKNEVWLKDDESPVTADEFLERISLSSISFDDDGNFELCFDDGGMFWEHTITVDGNAREGLTSAHLAG